MWAKKKNSYKDFIALETEIEKGEGIDEYKSVYDSHKG